MQKRFLRKAAFTLIMLLILVSASSALATTASKTYTEAKITHVWKCGPISRSSGSTKFTSGKDDNTRIVFAVSGLERYQVVELVNASNVSVSGQAEVPTGNWAVIWHLVGILRVPNDFFYLFADSKPVLQHTECV